MPSHDSRIQQALHGYRDGHRLLAASVTLPPQAEHTMAILSDLAGHGLVRDFEEYVTGYPLPEVGAYALAKTWYAPEMPRPGCVWTHTLLIPFARLGSTQSLEMFCRFFARPRVDEYASFSTPFQERNEGVSIDRDGFSAELLRRSRDVLCKLYDCPGEAILVPVRSPSVAETVFLHIWSQQWPRLRRGFAFCTGAISGRRIGGRSFDLQGVPHKSMPAIVLTIQDSVVAELRVGLAEPESEGWCGVAMDDLRGKNRLLREFLFEFGAEAEGGRRDFVPMVQVFSALHERLREPVDSLVEHLGVLFPSPSQGLKLKKRLLAGDIGSETMRNPDVPLQIVLRGGQTLFEMDRQQLRAMARRAWGYNPADVVETIGAMNERGAVVSDAVLAALADTLEPGQLNRASGCETTLMSLARHRPVILAHDTFRDMSGRNEKLLEHLIEGGGAPKEVRMIIGQWLREGAVECVERAVESSPVAAMPGLLGLLGGTGKEEDLDFPTDRLIGLCGRHSEQARQWLHGNVAHLRHGRVHAKAVGCIVAGIPYETIRITKRDIDDWELLLGDRGKLEPALRKVIVMRLFLRGMQMPGAMGARIATAAFPDIYWRLAKSQMSYQEWHVLQEEAIGFSWEWDRCRQLTEGLIERFGEFGWPKKYFERMLANDVELASRMERTRFYRSRYRKFIARGLK